MSARDETPPEILLEPGEISVLTLNRPDKLNSMTESMGRLLREAVSALNARDDVRVVVLRGAGRAFSAGGDMSFIEANRRRSPEQNRVAMLEFYGMFLSVLDLRVPSVAVLQGAAVGAGLCLALACDLRLAAKEAKLGANFVRVGLHPGMGATALLPRLVGAAKASELLLTGKLVSGEEAERIGLVNAAVPRHELEQLVATTLEPLRSAGPVALAQTKASLQGSLRAELAAALAREASAQAIDFTTQDLLEAVEAFRDGRTPRFLGQ